MRTSTHYLAGITLSFLATQLIFPDDRMASALFASGVLIGSAAPDWLEMPWRGGLFFKRRRSIIAHRTITHWPVLWGGLAVVAYEGGGLVDQLLMGFALGGLLHVLMDAMTPMGVPWLNPFRSRKHGGT